MKKIFLLVFVATLLTNCKKNNNNSPPPNNNNNHNSGIVIKGKFSGHKKVRNSDSLSLSDAKKVLVFSKYYYSLTDIANNSFSVSAQMGTGVALLFLDANNHYIGNLSSQGLNMLPLGNLTNGENTIIDLSLLTLVGNSVIPSHDPLGNEIQISATEINSLKATGEYYQAIAKNIDANNDSVPDVLVNKQLVITSLFSRHSGHWGHNDSVPVPTDSAHSYMNYSVEIDGGSALTFSNGNIILSGPADAPYTDITTWGYVMAPQCGANRGFVSSFNRQAVAPAGAPWGTAFLPLKQGTYTLTLDGSNIFTLNYANIDAKYNLVIVAPTLHTNNDGKLTSISFDYKLPDGSVINPASILTNVSVQLSDNQAHQFYNSTKLTTSTGFSAINLTTPIDISSLDHIDLGYEDLLGNTYDILWR